MNCEQCREEFVAYLEGLLDMAGQASVETHLTECAACQAEINEVRQLMTQLTNGVQTVCTVSFASKVMDRILREQAFELRRLKMRKRIRFFGVSGAVAAAAVVCLISSFWLTEPAQAQAEKAAKVMHDGAEAAQNPSSVHIVARVRTLPGDNFSLIGAEYDLVPVEVWKQFGDKQKWRVEKPRRVAVMDGKSTVMLMGGDTVVQVPEPCGAAFDTGWLFALTEVQGMLTRELEAAIAKKWDLKLDHETTASGEKLIVTVEAKSGLPADDYLRNKFFENSDTRRVYRFDAKTRRLEGFEAYLQQAGGNDLLIMTVDRIEYNEPIDPVVFTLKLPDTVNLCQEPQRLPNNEKYEKMTPKEAAQAFFTACEKQDWNEVAKFKSPLSERSKSYLSTIKLVSLGEPFQSKGYASDGKGWFVPYEIRVTRKIEPTVRNDNPAKRYVFFSEKEQPDTKRLAELKPLPDNNKYVAMTPKEMVQAVFEAYVKKRMAELKPLPDNDKYAAMTPKEVVQAVFEAYVKKDVDGALRFLEGAETRDEIKKEMEHLTISEFQVGEPTPEKEPGSWKVPVEITLTLKHNLAIRSDNAANRLIVDGGI